MRVLDTPIRFMVNVDSTIPHTLYGDQVKIRQTLINILGNAVKYTDRGFVSLTVRGEFVDDNTMHLILEIEDSGIGIKPHNLEKLFDEFAQFDTDTGRSTDGVGLGLAITNAIVQAMDGNINVQSEFGKGSVFTVVLPQKCHTREALAVVQNPKKKSVILYKRHEVYAAPIINTLENLGVDCTLVSSDDELSEKMSSKQYAFLFISLDLYHQNKDTVQQFKNNTKIVVFTEFGETVSGAIPDKDVNVLATPIYSVPVTNILNGEHIRRSHGGREGFVVRFSAPDAKILIVDDIKTNLKVAQGLMLPYGMRIELCENGFSAIEAVKSKDYDLIFMDHKMPDMDGVETTQRIRAMGKDDPYYKEVPIIALTANAVVGTRKMFLENGFNDFTSKPIGITHLNAVLEKWIPKNKQERSTAENSAIILPEKSDIGIAIDGLDVNLGIQRSGGMADVYFGALGSFCTDAVQRTEEIKKCLETGDISRYTVHVHGIKGAASFIGADSLSAEAATLEAAGNQGDVSLIEERTPSFLQALETVVANVQEYLNTESKITSNFDAEAVKSELAKLKVALDNYDIDTMQTIAETLLKHTQRLDVNKVISEISDHILTGEYDEASALVETALPAGHGFCIVV